jgi:hypothetical protein
MSERVKVVVTVPKSHADVLREAIAGAGGGTLGAYTHCSFSIEGVGRFRPQEGATPYLGQKGQVDRVVEERIELSCSEEALQDVLRAIRTTHPYEEPVIDVYALREID